MTTTKTIKGWVNNSNLLFSQNSSSDLFTNNLNEYIKANLHGYTTKRKKGYTHKVIIKGWYWRGSWSDPTKETVLTFYK
jgi:hypothetical protein